MLSKARLRSIFFFYGFLRVFSCSAYSVVGCAVSEASRKLSLFLLKDKPNKQKSEEEDEEEETRVSLKSLRPFSSFFPFAAFVPFFSVFLNSLVTLCLCDVFALLK